MAPLAGEWLEALKGEFRKPYYRALFQKVGEEYQTRKIFPPADDIFNAFHFTPLSQVKVVMLGQDPYHNDGQAHGLCFSVKKEVDIPPSLVNIYQELHDDLGCYIPNNGYSDATPPISMHVLAVYATHLWFSGSLAFNHHVMAGTNGTIVRVYNSRIIYITT